MTAPASTPTPPAQAADVACDDLVVEPSPKQTPRLIPPDVPVGTYVGSGDTWFIGNPGHRWSESVDFFRGSYYLKVAIYDLSSQLPSVTVRRTDGKSTGHAELTPTSRGMPGPIPTGLYFPTTGCWDVVARGSTGRAEIYVRAAPIASPPSR